MAGIAVEDYHNGTGRSGSRSNFCFVPQINTCDYYDRCNAVPKANTCSVKAAARTYPKHWKMQKVQHETGMTLNIGVVNRFNDMVNLIRQYIQDGRLGEVYHVYLSFRAFRSIPGLGGAFTTKEMSRWRIFD